MKQGFSSSTGISLMLASASSSDMLNCRLPLLYTPMEASKSKSVPLVLVGPQSRYTMRVTRYQLAGMSPVSPTYS